MKKFFNLRLKYHKMVSKNQRLEEIRAELGLNKTEFAEVMGISPHGYQHILAEKGKGNVTLNHVENLLKRYSVNPAWILTGIGEKFLNLKDGTGTLIAGHIIPDPPFADRIDPELLSHLVNAIITESQLPILGSDLSYAVAVRYGKYYIGKYPNATRDNLDIPALTAGFLTLLQTLQSLVNATFELQAGDKVQVRFGEQYYNFVRPALPDK
ncbi:MAG: helix-turn-helix domain-containing protein [Bacteroidetes bacterium]|nr:helix-turn-helix domain-containing protein [Bacteroidota bacterium]